MLTKLLNFDHFGIGLPKSQLVISDGYFDRIAERGDLADVDRNALCNAHIHDSPLNRAVSVDFFYNDVLTC